MGFSKEKWLNSERSFRSIPERDLRLRCVNRDLDMEIVVMYIEMEMDGIGVFPCNYIGVHIRECAPET
jgi:hypothetical protein